MQPLFPARAPDRLFIAAVLALSTACGDDDADGDGTDSIAQGESSGAPEGVGEEAGEIEAGATALVVLLNPVINDGHSVGTPGFSSDLRVGVPVDAEPGGEAEADAGGIAVVEAVVGTTELRLGEADTPPFVPLEVLAEGDVYDVAVAYDGDAVEYFDLTPIRYSVGEASGAIFIEPGTPISDIESELEADDVVVVLRPGTYAGDLVIRGRDVLLFGEGFSQSEVTLDGSIQVNGEAARIRGLTVNGDVVSAGNNFGMSFSVVRGETRITGNGGAFLHNGFCGAVSVPTDNAALLDNAGLAPLPPPSAEMCDPDDGGTGGETG